jgi:putative CRISPR-associated protein (TIGR02619 family)
MLLCVISTVGQSVFNNAGQYVMREWRAFRDVKDADLRAIVKRGSTDFDGRSLYEATLADLKALPSIDALRAASAELNSLDRILAGRKPNRGDRLYFLASDTPDGALAARVIADFCAEHFERETEICLVDGLQVHDGQRFRWTGLRSLINTLYDILGDAPPGAYTRILNPTGGFKGVVPYLTVVGMLEPEIEVSYIYERSPELITLQGLPLQLDYAALEAAFDALEACHRESLLSEGELAGLLKLEGEHVSTHPSWSLFEMVEDNGQRLYALNGLGQIVYRHLSEGRDQAAVYLSRQAAAAYDAYDPTKQRQFAAMFDRMGDPEWRRGVLHATKGDAKALKQGSTDARPLIIELDDCVLVAELTLHSDGTYDRTGDLRRKDYDKFRRWEGS